MAALAFVGHAIAVFFASVVVVVGMVVVVVTGTGVVVLPGSRIGRNVAVGAGSVVTGDLPDHCVAVGSPAKVVKRYTPEDGWRAMDEAEGDAGAIGAPGAGSAQKLAGSNGLTAPKKKKSATSDAAPPTT